MFDKKTVRVINRYLYRQAYDVDSSRYKNLADLRQLVIDAVKFQVKVQKKKTRLIVC